MSVDREEFIFGVMTTGKSREEAEAIFDDAVERGLITEGDDIKPCPFCGAEADMRREERMDSVILECPSPNCLIMPCAQYAAPIRKKRKGSNELVRDWQEAEQYCINAWNTRAGA